MKLFQPNTKRNGLKSKKENKITGKSLKCNTEYGDNCFLNIAQKTVDFFILLWYNADAVYL